MIRILFFLLFLFLPIDAFAAARFLVACTTACTWDNSSTLIWSTTSGGAPGSAAPTSADAVTLDANSCVGGVTCTITINANLNISSLTFGACTASTTGCILDFSANNNSVIAVTVSGTGTGVRQLKMGTNTWTITGTSGTPWEMFTSTNLTLTQGTGGTLLFSAVPSALRNLGLGSSQTYYNVTVTNASWSAHQINLTQFNATTITNNLTFTNVGEVVLSGGGNITINGVLSYDGTSTNQGNLHSTGSAATQITVANAAVLNWLMVQFIQKAGAGSITANNSFNGGGNASVAVNSPTSGGRCIGC